MNNKTVKATHITNMFLYTVMPLIKGLLSFLMLPILTRYLSPANYGIISLITMISTFSWMFCLGVNNASYRLFFKYKNDMDKLRELLSSNLVFIVLSSIFYCSIVIVIFPFINTYLFKNQLKIVWLILAIFLFSLVYVNTLNQDILKIKFEGKKWFFNELVSSIIMFTLSLILVVSKMFTFEAIILANLVAEIIKCIMIYAQLYSYYSLTFKVSFLKESLIYSWPQTPASVISFVYSYFDKLLLSRLRGLTQVGILDMSSRVSLILKTNMDGISGVFSPVSLELLTENTKESLKKLADICLQVVFFVLLLSLGIILFSKELILLLTAKEYHFAIYVAPIYIYYHIFGVLGMVAYWLIYFQAQKTFWQIPISIIGLISNTIANIILIPRYGLMGAAIAVFLSAGITQAVQFLIGIKITPIPINILKLSVMFFVLFTETAALYFLYYLNLGILLEILIKLIMLLAFVLVGLLGKICDYRLINEIFSIFLRKIGTLTLKKVEYIN